MGDFDQSMRLVFANEGYFSNDPNDRGGPTMWGLSTNFLKSIGDDRDTRSILKEEAVEVYRANFWDPMRGDELPDPLAAMAFDAAVNHGVSGGTKVLQRAVVALGGAVGSSGSDGKLGPDTLDGILDAWDRFGLVFAGYVLRGRQDVYDYLIRRDASQKRFLRGWINRLRRCASFCETGEVQP